jgi:hypothetical protein
LHEDGQRTLEGLIGSTAKLLETTAAHLLTLWRWRRNHPGELHQPAEQWKNWPLTQSTGFSGYAPGSLTLNPDVGTMHPITARRIHTAALDDAARLQWAAFD